MSVAIGLALDLGAPDGDVTRRFDALLDLVRVADEYPFHSLWAGESYVSHAGAVGGFHLPGALLALAALAQHTRLKVGTGVLLLPAYHPLKLAYETALLDQLTGGRLILGVGAARATLQARFGCTPPDVGGYLDDTLRALKALWSGQDGYRGVHLSLSGGIAPPPRQAGGPPIWVGGAIQRSAERAARLGDGYYASTSHTFQQVVRQSERYRMARERLGKAATAGTIAANRIVVVAETEGEARALAARYAGELLLSYARMGSLGPEWKARGGTPEALYEALGQDFCLVGTPDQIVERVQAYARAGVTNVQARVVPGGLPLEAAARSIRLLGEYVLPALS